MRVHEVGMCVCTWVRAALRTVDATHILILLFGMLLVMADAEGEALC